MVPIEWVTRERDEQNIKNLCQDCVFNWACLKCSDCVQSSFKRIVSPSTTIPLSKE